jgi:hypothetical protein
MLGATKLLTLMGTFMLRVDDPARFVYREDEKVAGLVERYKMTPDDAQKVANLGQSEEATLCLDMLDGTKHKFYSSGRSTYFDDEYYIEVFSDNDGMLFSTYHYDG